MYKVVCCFFDLDDEGHKYDIGQEYPREGYKPSEERVEFLSGASNRLGYPVIEKVEEKQEKPKTKARKSK